ncbi:hypothetical protein CAPTEDRAFT_228588 [Capitella teleta]|uniref:C3H1-type domain-containing protein n=1 Tax=Capitella teleta TaxID=283909 RepID=R7VHF3_CAPTE|nr:hypothetical protein CAPTEDRAFT_228588 [Capitella teleta]|eukprot:ELU15125.1 hypothetical protein CAPTEDRAFT_228588 [Capitella teleta]
MASLVADYASDSENEADEADTEPQWSTESSTHSTNLLLGDSLDDDAGDSSSSGEDDSGLKKPSQRLPNPLMKLPLPKFGANSSSGALEHSVFVTDYAKAEAAKDSILQQHVQMTKTQLPNTKDARKVCYNFRRGCCKRGSKCRFFHDNSTPQREEVQDTHSYYGNRSAFAPVVTEKNDDDSFNTEQKVTKKRSGISDRLIPPKKAMKSLDKERHVERPWTVQHE